MTSLVLLLPGSLPSLGEFCQRQALRLRRVDQIAA